MAYDPTTLDAAADVADHHASRPPLSMSPTGRFAWSAGCSAVALLLRAMADTERATQAAAMGADTP